MATINLLDIAKRNGSDKVVGLIEENLNVAPEMRIFPARTIAGTSYKALIRTALPAVAFANVGESLTAVKSSWTNKLVSAYYLAALLQVPKAAAKASEDGEDAVKADEASGVMKSALQTVGKVTWYGQNATHGDAKGFPGAIDCYDSTNMVVDAGGTTATTGSSAWLVKFGPQDCQMVVGLNGVIDLSEWRVETISGVPSHVADLTAYIGCQFVNVKSLVRIKKLTADSGKGLTDALIANALSKFPAGVVPDAIFCSRRSVYQLQSSRTVALQQMVSGGGKPSGANNSLIAPIPTESMGIPVYATDSISDVEALTL